jgi:hypothetical protein
MVRGVRALADDRLRVGYLVDILTRAPALELAAALDAWCVKAEQLEAGPREALIALVDALATEAVQPALGQLRNVAASEGLLALERLVRRPTSVRSEFGPRDPNEARVPDYGRGRPLTLGERKALARRPDRASMDRLLADPHPDVIRGLLANPRLTEDDVLRLATKRPCRADVLTQIARSPRWMHCTRIRRAVVLNPDTPSEITTSLVSLLLRQELKLVVEATHVSPAIRALCCEHLERRPPVDQGHQTQERGDEPLQ